MCISGTGRISSAVLLTSSMAVWWQPMRVSIDVKPGDTPTTVEANREGMLPVAILSTAQFDAATVDPASIRVGPTGTEAEPFRAMADDINRDERMDLLILVRLQEMKVKCDDKVIRLTAKTQAGADIEGSEAVTVTCK